MILAIVLLFLFIILSSLLIIFLFYVLNPSIKITNEEDVIVANSEINYFHKELSEVKKSNKKAVVLCSCNKEFSSETIKFNKNYSCLVVSQKAGTGNDCGFSCIGLGDCAKVCPQKAIFIQNNTAKISNLCIGCGLCVNTCPMNLIKLVKPEETFIKLCNNCNENTTTCSKYQNEEKLEWNNKKDFKIWSYCYKILKKK